MHRPLPILVMIALGVLGVGTALVLPGCMAAFGAASAIGKAIEEEGSHKVYGEYGGLKGKSFAVIISADRVIQGNDPRAVSRLTNAIIRKMVSAEAQIGAVGFVPGAKVLAMQYNKPSWTTWNYGKIADEFGVERLIFVDLYEYRLNEPGNAYLWVGQITGKVGVVEADGSNPDEFVFTKEIRVGFPDKTGVSTRDMPKEAVQANLEDRYSSRVAWLFFDHDEPNTIKY